MKGGRVVPFHLPADCIIGKSVSSPLEENSLLLQAKVTTMTSRTQYDRAILSAKMKLAELININYNLLGVLSRFDMKLGFGEETVGEACARYGLDVSTFLLICNIYTFDTFVPSKDLLDTVNVLDIVRYLHSSHSFYIDFSLQSLEESLEKMLEPCDERRKKVIWKFFKDYRDELARHFEYEEKTVFPYVESVVHYASDSSFRIIQYEENHTNVEEKLSDLKNIVMKYLPPECDNQLINRALLYIYILEDDLSKHTSIEDDILVPAVNRLEDRLRPASKGEA